MVILLKTTARLKPSAQCLSLSGVPWSVYRTLSDALTDCNVTHSSMDRLAIYQALCVPEIWRFDGVKIEVYLLEADGKYRTAKESPTFPGIRIDRLVRWLKRGRSQDDLSVKKAFAIWVRKQLGE